MTAKPDNPALTLPLDALMERLDVLCRRHFGNQVRVDGGDEATLGGSNRTIVFKLVDGGYQRGLVLRQETVPPSYTPFLPSHTQYQILSVVYRHGVAVPQPLFELKPADGLGDGYLMQAIRGETLPKTLLNDTALTTARHRYLEQAGFHLARMHAIPTSEFDFLENVVESGDPLAAQMFHYNRYGEPHPALDFAFRWLEQHRPDGLPRSFLHGDFRNGNVIVGAEGIRAWLDWECAHLGDPLEDFGWFCTRSWRFGRVAWTAGGLGQRETLYRAYEAASGKTIDRSATKWWEVFGLLRWAMYNVMQVYGHVSGQRRSPVFAACGRNTALVEYDLLKTINGDFD